MILITGATGHLGKATLDFLLKSGVPANSISALVRDEVKATDLKATGVTVRTGNYDDYNSLVSAFQGVDKLLLISGSDLTNRLKQHENSIKAAREANVKHIVYTSFVRKNETDKSPIAFVAKSHIETERLIKGSGIPYTIMLNTLYADMLPIFFGEKVLGSGIFLPAGEGKAAFATRSDMAEALARVLSTPGHENKEYVIANSSNYSMEDAAGILSEITGRKVSYARPTEPSFREEMAKAGVPQEYVGMFASFSEAIRQGEFETNRSDLETLIGRKPTPLKEFLKTIYTTNN